MIDKNSRVLVVDDFELIRVMLISALKDMGIKNIKEAEDGAQALRLLEDSAAENSPFSVMFLDWNMPELDGLELLKKCRADQRFMKLPIVMVTAESEKPYVLKALSAGASDYITKPFSSDVLKDKVAALNNRLRAVK